MTRTDLLCIGLTTLDIIGRPILAIPDQEGTSLIEEIEVIPAGTAGGTALVAARLGLSVLLASAVGDDRKGRILGSALDDAGIDCSLLRTINGAPTSATMLAVDGQGRRPNFHAVGAASFMSIDDDMRRAARDARFVHYGGIGSPHLDMGPGAGLMSEAHASGAVTSCDLIIAGPQVADELRRVLPYVDWFLPSAAEALGITGAATIEDAAETFLAWGARGVIVKDGARGAVLVEAAGSVVRSPAFAIDAVDTTSCGDAFCAGFIAALASGTASVHDAILTASATAALVAQGIGTLGKVESLAATQAAVATMPRRADCTE